MRKPRVIAYSILFTASIVTAAVSVGSAATHMGATSPVPMNGSVSAGGDFGPVTAGASFDSQSLSAPVAAPGLPSIPNGLPNVPSGLPKIPSLPKLPSAPGVPSVPGVPNLPIGGVTIPSVPTTPSLTAVPSLSDVTDVISGVTDLTSGGLPSLSDVTNAIPGTSSLSGLTSLLP